jgi:hypothetical protein
MKSKNPFVFLPITIWKGAGGVDLESERIDMLRGLKILVVEVQSDSWWRDWKDGASGDQNVLDGTKQNKVASIMDTSMRHLRSSHALKCYTVLFILPNHPQELEKEVRIRPVVVGVKGLRTDCDNSAFWWRIIQGGIVVITVHMSPFSCYFLSLRSTLLFTPLLSIAIYSCYSLLLRKIFHLHRKGKCIDIYTTLDWISVFGVLRHFCLTRTKKDN